VIPSLALFPVLAGLLRYGMSFWLSMAGAIAVTVLAYVVIFYFLNSSTT
jgi:hypothetical protein